MRCWSLLQLRVQNERNIRKGGQMFVIDVPA